MKLQFERRPGAICAVLVEPGECDRIASVVCASDAFSALALDVDAGAYAPLNALFAFARVVCVEIERRDGGWRVEVVYWRAALGALTQYETEALTPAAALVRCVRALLLG